MTNVRARYDGSAGATSIHFENLEEIEVKLSAYWCSLLLSCKYNILCLSSLLLLLLSRMYPLSFRIKEPKKKLKFKNKENKKNSVLELGIVIGLTMSFARR